MTYSDGQNGDEDVQVKPQELQKFLEEIGLSQRRAAFELGIDERTMRRYVSGETPVPRSIELALASLRRQVVEMSELSRLDLIEVRDAEHDFKQMREPGARRQYEVTPLCDAMGKLVEIQFRWADGSKRLIARTRRDRNGHWQTEAV